MNIAIDARSINLYGGTGIGTYTNNLVNEILNIDKESNYSLIWTGEKSSTFPQSNYKYLHTSGRNGGFFEKYYIPNFIQNNNFDLYHIPQNGIGFPFDYDLKTIVTIHDLIPYTMPETVGKGYLERFIKDMPHIISQSAGILTVSEYSKLDILKFFPFYDKDKIFVTQLSANSNYKPLNKDYCRNHLKTNYNLENPFILYLGGFSTRKNVLSLIKAFINIKKSLTKDYKLVLVGSIKDEGEKLREYVKNINKENDVIFTGFVDESLLPIFYNSAEIFVYPSFYEGFGLPPLEAMKCGTPVIASNITSIPEVTGDSAILIDPNNIQSLESKIKLLLNNEDYRLSIGKKGYEKSLQFSWRQTAIDTLKAYNSIINLP